MGQYVRSFVETVLTGQLCRVESLSGKKLKCISDCKSLFDHFHREGVPRVPSHKRLAIDLAALRQAFSREISLEKIPLYWLPTDFQLADTLTKPKCSKAWWNTINGLIELPFVKSSSCDETMQNLPKK